MAICQFSAETVFGVKQSASMDAPPPEGIRNFATDAVKLEAYIAKKI